MDSDHLTDQSGQNEVASPIAPQPLQLPILVLWRIMWLSYVWCPAVVHIGEQQKGTVLWSGWAYCRKWQWEWHAVSSIVSHQLKALELHWLLRS